MDVRARERAAGHETVALGHDELATRIGDLGFETIRTVADPAALAEAARATVRASAERPTFLWLDLPAPAAGTRGPDGTLVGLLEEIESAGLVPSTVLLVAGLRAVSGNAEDLLAVPVVLQLPGAKGHGARQRGHHALSDVLPGVAEILRFSDARALDLAPPDGRGESFTSAAVGANRFETVRLEGSFGFVVRAPGPDGQFPGFRAYVPAGEDLLVENATISLLPDCASDSTQLQRIGGQERSYAVAMLPREFAPYR
ncbi:MAG: hypothetical protein R3F34_08570 [Planctomycetota bacterium]